MEYSRKFNVAFATGFFFTLSVVILIGFGLSNNEKKFHLVSKTVGIHEQSRNLKISSPDSAKLHHLFWASRGTPDGVALNVLEDSDLFMKIFPGYPDSMRTDKNLWDKYFSREFGSEAWISYLELKDKTGLQVSYSWTGCLDIYKKYGADIVIIGNSETYRTIVPDLLGSKFSNYKVLMCATSHMVMETAALTLTELKKANPQKAKLVIWGFSAWNAYRGADRYPSLIQSKKDLIQTFVDNPKPQTRIKYLDGFDFQTLLSLKIPHYLPEITWQLFFPIQFFDLYKVEDNHSLTLSLSSGNDPAKLKQFLDSKTGGYDMLQGISSKDCDMTGSSKSLDLVSQAIFDIADEALIYLVPTSELQYKPAPDCFVTSVKSMLETKKSKNLITITLSSENYGLVPEDFLGVSETGKSYHFDKNHPNFYGAQKVTTKLVDTYRENGGRL